MIGGRRSLQGRKPGDKRVRVERPHAPYFRYTGPGQLTAKEAASVPTTPGAKLAHKIRGVVLGRPLASEDEAGERLSKVKALAIFSSDAISSSAYATEEILRAFVLAGAAMAAFTFAIPVSIAIALLLAVVAFSLPPGVHRLSERRRVVFGLEGEPRPDRLARGGLGAAHRLQPDGRGVDVVGGRADRLGAAGARTDRRRHRRHGDRADDDRQPARPARGRQHLRGPDLPVPVQRIPDDRPGRLPDRRAGRDADARGVARRRRGHDPGRRDPRAATGVLVGRRGPDRHGGDRDRRAGLQATGVAQRGDDAHGDGGRPRRAVRRHHLPGRQLRGRATGASRGEDRHRAGGHASSSAPTPSASTCSRPSRRCCCSSPRTRRSTPSRAWARSSRSTGSSRVSSPSAATAWPSRAGSSRSGSSRPRSS